MSHDRESGFRELSNRIRDGASAFQLHRSCTTLLEEPRRVFHCLLGRYLVGQKRHVSHNQRAPGASRHAEGVVDYCLQSYRNRGVQSQDHVPKRVAYKNDVDACSVEEPRHGGIVRSQHDDPFASFFHLGEIWHTKLLWYRSHFGRSQDFFNFRRRSTSIGRLPKVSDRIGPAPRAAKEARAAYLARASTWVMIGPSVFSGRDHLSSMSGRRKALS